VKVLPREHIVALRDGRRFRYDDLVSTMPLPELFKAIGEEAPQELRNGQDLEASRRWLKQFDIALDESGAQAVLAAKRARAQKAGAE
jgi:hypothetical protein